jgi:hypothetical protein
MSNETFAAWFEALEQRQLADLTFAEVRRGVQAVSSLYVERRGRARPGAVFEGAGKRAAFALYYGPLHFLLVLEIVRRIGAAEPPPGRIVDLGCGTGVAGAAWAVAAGGRPRVSGHDRNAWAVAEARWTYRALGLGGRAIRGDLRASRLPGGGDAVVAAFTINELDDPARSDLQRRLLAASDRGARVLVVEPIARRPVPWWDSWSARFVSRGGRDDTWRFDVELPETLRLMDRAAGLDHRELTGRSLFVGGD